MLIQLISDEAWELLEPATKGFEDLKRSDVEIGLATGEYVLFETENSAAVASRVGNDTLRIGLAGGKLSELQILEQEIIEFAHRHSLPIVEIVGRQGWARALQGYTQIAVVLRKHINGIH